VAVKYSLQYYALQAPPSYIAWNNPDLADSIDPKEALSAGPLGLALYAARVGKRRSTDRHTRQVMAMHMVPLAPGKTRWFIHMAYISRGKGFLPGFVERLINMQPKWFMHLFTHNILDGDSVLLHHQVQ
jgi:hypothetical protein